MNIGIDDILKILVCPSCRGFFNVSEGKLVCKGCGTVFSANKYGFMEFLIDKKDIYQVDATIDNNAKAQQTGSVRLYNEYLGPFLLKEPFKRVLDVGCGIGRVTSMLLNDGYDAYGIDLSYISQYWSEEGNDAQHFFIGDATKIPFLDNFFDVVFSLGVIEHIGTKIGHYTLCDNYWEVRHQYANEILRVTRPGGRIIIACPNKSFPIDVQHGPNDGLTSESEIRNYIFNRTRINFHPVWGKYHLLSYSETKRIFCHNGGAGWFEPLSLKGYSGFSSFSTGFLSHFMKLAQIYVNNFPCILRPSFLNPYMVVQIRK